MGRPKKNGTEEMLRIVEQFFEEEMHGNPERMKCSTLEEYSEKKGTCIKAYMFRRDKEVRKRMEELKNIAQQSREMQSPIVYKNFDVDGLLKTCGSLQELKKVLVETDRYWKSVYDRAISTKEEMDKVVLENIRLESDKRSLEEQVRSYKKEAEDNQKTINGQVREIRYLKRMLSSYLYPALANELLRQSHLPSEQNESVQKKAFEELIDGNRPSAFQGLQMAKEPKMTRQEKLLAEMRNQIDG